jgi:acyl dehydratase
MSGATKEIEPEEPGRGMWFDDFREGQSFVSPGRTITETDVVNFAGLSGDYTALHTDEVHARKTPFRRRVAHGMLVQAIGTGLGVRTGIFEGTIAALSDMVIHWHQPVFPGDTVRLLLQVESLDEKPSRRSGRVVFSARMLNQKNQLVIDGVWTTLMVRQRKRARGSEGAGSSPEG